MSIESSKVARGRRLLSRQRDLQHLLGRLLPKPRGVAGLLLSLWWAHLWRTALFALLANFLLLTLVAIVDRSGMVGHTFVTLLQSFGKEEIAAIIVVAFLIIEGGAVLLSSLLAWRTLARASIIRALFLELEKRYSFVHDRAFSPAPLSATEEPPSKITVDHSSQTEEEAADDETFFLDDFEDDAVIVDKEGEEKLPITDSRKNWASSIDGRRKEELPELLRQREAIDSNIATLWRLHLNASLAPLLLAAATFIVAGTFGMPDLILTVAVGFYPLCSLVALHTLTISPDAPHQ